MSNKIVHIINEPIFAGTSYDIAFDCQQINNDPLNPSSVKVYVMLTGDYNQPQYINNRNGSNSAGLNFNESSISLHLSPGDSALLNEDGGHDFYEIHSIIFEVSYNNDTDKFFEEFRINIIKAPVD
jgi:hypothetical protein